MGIPPTGASHPRRAGVVTSVHLPLSTDFRFPDTWCHQLVIAAHELGITPAAVSADSWHEHTNTERLAPDPADRPTAKELTAAW